MPSGRGRQVLARLAVMGALSLTILVVGWLLFSSGDGYRLTLTLDNASQLVRGNQVKVGGVPVGTITKIELADDARAEIEIEITDDELTPLHKGTTAEVRSTSLSGIANRYVAVIPGPNSEDELEEGTRLPARNVQSEVDLDEVLNTLSPEVLEDLRSTVRGLGGSVANRGRELEEAIHALNPALSQTRATAEEVARDEDRFARFLVESAAVVNAVASRSDDLERLVPATGSALSAVASRTAEFDDSLRRLPPTLRLTNTTLVNLRGLLGDLRPVIAEARPAAPLLTETLTRLRPVARRGRQVIPALRRLIDRPGGQDLTGVLRTMPSLQQPAEDAFGSGVKSVDESIHIVRELRPYVPDLLAGPIRGFGGTTAMFYDANGRYTRISFQGSGFSLAPGTNQLVPLPPSEGNAAFLGYRSGIRNRCPGAGTQRNPDGSNPWLERPDFPCDESETPP